MRPQGSRDPRGKPSRTRSGGFDEGAGPAPCGRAVCGVNGVGGPHAHTRGGEAERFPHPVHTDQHGTRTSKIGPHVRWGGTCPRDSPRHQHDGPGGNYAEREQANRTDATWLQSHVDSEKPEVKNKQNGNELTENA